MDTKCIIFSSFFKFHNVDCPTTTSTCTRQLVYSMTCCILHTASSVSYHYRLHGPVYSSASERHATSLLPKPSSSTDWTSCCVSSHLRTLRASDRSPSVAFTHREALRRNQRDLHGVYTREALQDRSKKLKVGNQLICGIPATFEPACSHSFESVIELRRHQRSAHQRYAGAGLTGNAA